MELSKTLLDFIMKDNGIYTQYTNEEANEIIKFKNEASKLVGSGNCATFNFEGELLSTSMRATAKIKDTNLISYNPQDEIINITLGNVQSLINTHLIRKS